MSSSDTLPIAKIVNQANQPLVLIENNWWSYDNFYSINHFLQPKVQIQFLAEGKIIKTIPEVFSNVFLFNPSETLQKQLKKSQNYEIKSIYNGESFLLWKLGK